MNTTYFLNLVAGNVFGAKSDPAIPTKYYIGLSKTAPTTAGGNVTEPSGGGYARVEITNLSEPVNGLVTNLGNIEFPETTSAWGVCTHFVVYDSLIGGNLLMFDKLEKSRDIQSDTTMMYKAEKLKLSVVNVSA